MRSGVLHAAGTRLSDSAALSESAAATGKDGRPTVGKPRQLLGDQLVAVDENQTARVERHRPSPRGANYMVLTDIHCMPRQIAEILDHRAVDLAVRPRIDTHPHIHRHAAIAGIASRPAISAFHPPFHTSSPQVVCVKIVTQLEHDQPTPSGLMADDHHAADPDRQNHRRGLAGGIEFETVYTAVARANPGRTSQRRISSVGRLVGGRGTPRPKVSLVGVAVALMSRRSGSSQTTPMSSAR